MAAARSRRRAGTKGGVSAAGRAWADVAPELQAWSILKDDQAAGGLPAGFNSVVAAVLALGVESTTGLESSGWAAADHIHKLDLGLSSPGDILAFDTTGYVAIPQGAAIDGYVLTRDAASPGRAKWAASGAGSLELLEAHDFVADATGYTFAGLDGDVDEIYVLLYRLIKATSTATQVDVEPNGLTTNQESRGQYFGTAGTGVLNSTTMRILSNGTAGIGDIEAGWAQLHAKTGTFRSMRADWTQAPVAGGVYGISMASVWADSVTNITSLGVIASVASGIKAGSYVDLYRLES